MIRIYEEFDDYIDLDKIDHQLTFKEIIEFVDSINDIRCELVDYDSDLKTFKIEVINGDWKHDHLYLDSLVTKKWPFVIVLGTTVTEEDGSDTYSGIHEYQY